MLHNKINNNDGKGQLIVVAGPSGAGKTTLVKALVQSMTDLKLSISHTTRAIRPGEQDGVNYYFVTESAFKEMLEKRDFLEYAMVYDHYYGTSKVWVENELRKGSDIILELDWQGAKQIRNIFGDKATFIYILPPSLEKLHQRLKSRAQDNLAVITSRLAKAKNDISHYHDFDYLVVNENLEQAVIDLKSILISRRLAINYQEKNLNKLLQQLLR